MRRHVFLWVAVIGPTLNTALAPPAVASLPITIGDISFASGRAGNCLDCMGLVYESGGNPFVFLDPDSGKEIPASFDTSPIRALNQEYRPVVDRLQQLTSARWSLGIEDIMLGDDKVIGLGPFVSASGHMIKFEDGSFSSPLGSAHAKVTLDYTFQVDILESSEIPGDADDDLLELLDVLHTVSMPVSVMAKAGATISPEFDVTTAQLLMARASVTVTNGSHQPFEPLVASVNVFSTQNVPSAEFSGVAFFQVGTPYNVTLEASGQARSNGFDKTTLGFVARADPAFALDVEALRVELLARGIDYPEPERFVQLRFNPDIEYALANFVPEPSALLLTCLGVLFATTLRGTRV